MHLQIEKKFTGFNQTTLLSEPISLVQLSKMQLINRKNLFDSITSYPNKQL